MITRKNAAQLTPAEQRYIDTVTQLNSGTHPTPYAQLVAEHAGDLESIQKLGYQYA